MADILASDVVLLSQSNLIVNICQQAGFGLGLFLMVFMAGVMLYTSYLIMKSSQSIG